MATYAFINQYFWLIALLISVFHYVIGIFALIRKPFPSAQLNNEAKRLQNWFGLGSALPWIYMGYGMVFGGVPNIWGFLKPQNGNFYVVSWYGLLLALALIFLYWVFLRGGARKVVEFQLLGPVWHRFSFNFTEGKIKLIAAIAPVWVALVVLIDFMT